MKYHQLYDPLTQTVFTIDGKALVFTIASDTINMKLRLKPHHASILSILFEQLPKPVSYRGREQLQKKELL